MSKRRIVVEFVGEWSDLDWLREMVREEVERELVRRRDAERQKLIDDWTRKYT